MSVEEHPIPLAYRIIFTWVEPIIILSGALQAFFDPATILTVGTPNIKYNASLHPLFAQIAGGWLVLAFHAAITLRCTRDVRIWRLVHLAIFMSDIIYTLSVLEDMGAPQFYKPWKWSSVNWLTMLLTVIPMAIRVLFLLGVGLGEEANTKSKRV